MSLHCVKNVTTFEHFDLDLEAQSSVRLVNHKFNEDTLVENTFPPGLYISMLGKCQCKILNQEADAKRNYNHQYVAALVEKQSSSQMLFPCHSEWQSFSIMLPLSKLNKNTILTNLCDNAPNALSHIRFSELGPVPSDILRCCEAAWDCTFEGFERELFIKAKAQEVLALFLHKRRIKDTTQASSRLTQLSNALSQVQTNLAEDWTLSSVASIAASNRTYLKQDMKELLGVSFRDWLKQTRLEAAREQLAGPKSITQISHNVGFKSQAHFATLFKSEMGTTPSKYRQSLLIQHIA